MASRNGFDVESLNFPEPTPADLEALERAERLIVMSPEEYLEFLRLMTANRPASRETNSDSDEPFVL